VTGSTCRFYHRATHEHGIRVFILTQDDAATENHGPINAQPHLRRCAYRRDRLPPKRKTSARSEQYRV
jgi:hypothetical protein